MAVFLLHNMCTHDFTQLNALIVGVEQEGAEAVGHIVVGQELQVVLTELKLHGELQVDLKVGGKNPGQWYLQYFSTLLVVNYLLDTILKPDVQPHLVDTVQELQEDGGEAAALAAQRLSPTVAESVAE